MKNSHTFLGSYCRNKINWFFQGSWYINSLDFLGRCVTYGQTEYSFVTDIQKYPMLVLD